MASPTKQEEVFDDVGRLHESRKRIRDAAQDQKISALLRPSVGKGYNPAEHGNRTELLGDEFPVGRTRFSRGVKLAESLFFL